MVFSRFNQQRETEVVVDDGGRQTGTWVGTIRILIYPVEQHHVHRAVDVGRTVFLNLVEEVLIDSRGKICYVSGCTAVAVTVSIPIIMVFTSRNIRLVAQRNVLINEETVERVDVERIALLAVIRLNGFLERIPYIIEFLGV